jgi:hypothetical protein
VSPWGGFIRKVARGAWHRDAKAFGNGGAAGCKVFAEELFGAEVLGNAGEMAAAWRW